MADRKIWIVKGRNEDATEFCEFVFDEWEEYMAFCKRRPKQFNITDILERLIADSETALEYAADCVATSEDQRHG